MKKDLLRVFIALRWPNLILTAFTITASYYLLVLPALNLSNTSSLLYPIDILLLCLSTVFVMAGAYIVNNWMDIESDFHNNKARGIEVIPRRFLLIWYVTFSFSGLMLALILCLRISHLELWFIHIGAFILLLVYSTNLKSTPLVGNIVVAALCGFIPLLPLIFELKTFDVILNSDFIIVNFLGLFAFLITMIRELIKDMEDVSGDKESNLATFPVIFGMKAARGICQLFFTMFFILMASVLYMLADKDVISLIYLIICVVVPSLYLNYRLIKSKAKSDFSFISRGLKLVMLSGTGSAIIFYFSYP